MMSHRTPRFAVWATGIFALLAGLSPALTEAQSTRLTWDWSEGDQLTYRVSQDDARRLTYITDDFSDRPPLDNSGQRSMWVDLSVGAVDGEGNAEITMTVRAYDLSADETGQDTFSIDTRTLSDYSKLYDNRAQPWVGMLGRPMVATVSASGRVIGDVTNAEETFARAVDTRLTAEALPERYRGQAQDWAKALFGSFIPYLPEQAVRPNDTWTQTYTTSIDIYATVHVDVTYTLGRVTSDRATISVRQASARVDLTPGANDVLVAEAVDVVSQRIDVSGAIVFDTSAGRVLQQSTQTDGEIVIGLRSSNPDAVRGPRVRTRFDATTGIRLLNEEQIENNLGPRPISESPETVWQSVDSYRAAAELDGDPIHLQRAADGMARFITEVADRDTPARASAVTMLATLANRINDLEIRERLVVQLDELAQLEGMADNLVRELYVGKAVTQASVARSKRGMEKIDNYQAALNTLREDVFPHVTEMSDASYSDAQNLRSLVLRLMGRGEELLSTLSRELSRRTASAERQIVLLRVYVAALIAEQRWETAVTAADQLLGEIDQQPNELRPIRIEALLAKAKALSVDIQPGLQATIDQLGELGRAGERALEELAEFRTLTPGSFARSFILPTIRTQTDEAGRTTYVTGPNVGLADSEGVHTAMLFIRGQEIRHLVALRRLRDVTAMYRDEEAPILAIHAIAAGPGLGGPVNEVGRSIARLEDTDPITLLYDRYSTVGTAYGVDAQPLLVLVDATGRIVYAERVMPSLRAFDRFSRELERELELADTAPLLGDDQEDTSPEFRLVQETIQRVGLGESIAARARSLSRTVQLLGESGRQRVRTALMLDLLRADDDRQRAIIRRLVTILTEAN